MNTLTLIALVASSFAAAANFYRAWKTVDDRLYHVAIAVPALLYAAAYALDLAGVMDPLHVSGETNLLRWLLVSVMLILGSFAVRKKRKY